MSSWAIINKETNIVENIVSWDGSDIWQEPINTYKININSLHVHIGSTYDKSTEQYIEPVFEIPVVKPTLKELQTQLENIKLQITALANTSS